jgi:hypothetical protein
LTTPIGYSSSPSDYRPLPTDEMNSLIRTSIFFATLVAGLCFASAEVKGDDSSSDPGASQTSLESPNQARWVERSGELVELRQEIRDCLATYYDQFENVSQRSPWGVMHSLIAYGVDTQVYVRGRKKNAIGWLCWNGECRGQRLFYTAGGKLQTRQGPGLQGHQGQFLAMLAQARVKRDYPLRIEGYKFTVADLIEHEKETCQADTELSFKLIGLAYYLDSDATWRNRGGEEWSVSRLIREELAQPVIGEACGGTHRMMGFSYAVQRRQKSGRQFDGQWRRVKRFVDAYHDYTFQLQNSDGSFSTEWFRARGADEDLDRRLQTTGHILEWLVYSLPKEELQSPRVVKSVDYLATLLLEHKERDWEVGPRGHALHALAMYDERVFGSKPGKRDLMLTRGNSR